MNHQFSFLKDYDQIDGENISLKILSKTPGAENELPFYWYSIVKNSTGEMIGKVSLRVGTGLQAYWGGNIGYEIDEPCRGHHYACESVRLLFPLALKHGMKNLFITCDDSNIASIKTIEALGGQLLETAIPPKEYYAYHPGMEKQRVYLVDISK